MLRSCAVGIWAVRQGSPLSENDGPLACSVVKLCSICWIMYVAVEQIQATRCIPLKRCRCSECMRMISCYMFIVPEGRACLVHVGVWRCVKCTFFGTFTLIIVSFGTSC